MSAPCLKVTVAPGEADPQISGAVTEGGGTIVAPRDAEALIWTGKGPDGLHDVLVHGPSITWVQLPSAGIEAYTDLLDDDHTWTCAKGIYAQQVAEHALALMLAGLHRLPELARVRSWQKTVCRDLRGGRVTIVGGGGIARALLDLLRPFETDATVIRRHPQEMDGAARVLGVDAVGDALGEADAVVLALPLTAETRHMLSVPQLHAMKDDAWLVNVGRGQLVDTDALVTALTKGWIGGAALDVTDPEPLPDGHPLWYIENCLITPHCANPPALEKSDYVALIRDNVRHRLEGEPLEGRIDPHLGY